MVKSTVIHDLIVRQRHYIHCIGTDASGQAQTKPVQPPTAKQEATDEENRRDTIPEDTHAEHESWLMRGPLVRNTSGLL